MTPVSECRRRFARLDGPGGNAGGVRLRDHARHVVGDETLGAVRPDHRAVVVQRHLPERVASGDIFIESHLHHLALVSSKFFYIIQIWEINHEGQEETREAKAEMGGLC